MNSPRRAAALVAVIGFCTPRRVAPAIRFLGSLLAIVFVASLIMTGCGGGTQQNNPSQDTTSQQTEQERTSKQGAAKLEFLSGRVVKTLPDKDKVRIKPKNGEVVPFKYSPDNFKVRLEGQEAKPDAISEGQKAKVKYVQIITDKGREVNRARTIWLKSGAGAKQGGETTG
jgi:major membrane immunogen (membrane-anchored lipoprotein)